MEDFARAKLVKGSTSSSPRAWFAPLQLRTFGWVELGDPLVSKAGTPGHVGHCSMDRAVSISLCWMRGTGGAMVGCHMATPPAATGKRDQPVFDEGEDVVLGRDAGKLSPQQIHWVTVPLPAIVAVAFSVPMATLERLGMLDKILDRDPAVRKARWLENMVATRPATSQRNQTTRLLAQVE